MHKVLLLCVLLLAACTQYEEGPAVSLRSACNAIKGEWENAAFTVDGADSLWLVNKLHLQGKWEFKTSYDGKGAPSGIEQDRFSVVSEEDTARYWYSGYLTAGKKSAFLNLNFNPQSSINGMLYVNSVNKQQILFTGRIGGSSGLRKTKTCGCNSTGTTNATS